MEEIKSVKMVAHMTIFITRIAEIEVFNGGDIAIELKGERRVEDSTFVMNPLVKGNTPSTYSTVLEDVQKAAMLGTQIKILQDAVAGARAKLDSMQDVEQLSLQLTPGGGAKA